MLQAGVAKAEALGCKVSLAVVDQSCPDYRLSDHARDAPFLDHHHTAQGHHRRLPAPADRLCMVEQAALAALDLPGAG
jgi:hypothetical protein